MLKWRGRYKVVNEMNRNSSFLERQRHTECQLRLQCLKVVFMCLSGDRAICPSQCDFFFLLQRSTTGIRVEFEAQQLSDSFPFCFLARSSHSTLPNYDIFLSVINFIIFFFRPFFLFVKIILKSSHVSFLNSNNYTYSSIILVINYSIQLYPIQNRSHQNHELY